MTPVQAYKTMRKQMRKSFLEGNTCKLSVERLKRSQIYPEEEGVQEIARVKALQ